MSERGRLAAATERARRGGKKGKRLFPLHTPTVPGKPKASAISRAHAIDNSLFVDAVRGNNTKLMAELATNTTLHAPNHVRPPALRHCSPRSD